MGSKEHWFLKRCIKLLLIYNGLRYYQLKCCPSGIYHIRKQISLRPTFPVENVWSFWNSPINQIINKRATLLNVYIVIVIQNCKITELFFCAIVNQCFNHQLNYRLAFFIWNLSHALNFIIPSSFILLRTNNLAGTAVASFAFHFDWFTQLFLLTEARDFNL